eukprot:359402-Chlamydomonas_euryale.AAC.2
MVGCAMGLPSRHAGSTSVFLYKTNVTYHKNRAVCGICQTCKRIDGKTMVSKALKLCKLIAVYEKIRLLRLLPRDAESLFLHMARASVLGLAHRERHTQVRVRRPIHVGQHLVM